MSMANPESGDSYEGAGMDRAQPATDARQQIREMKDQVVDQAKSGLRKARQGATSSLVESRNQFAEQIGAVSRALRRTSEHLRSEDQQRVAGLTETAARQADRVADYLRTFNPRTTRDDLESLARRQPALVLGGAFALGLLGARFFKSSRRRDGGNQTNSGGYQATMNAGETNAWS
jgi:hypothetical protein